MSDTELEHLIKMINQIADNVTPNEAEDVRAQNVAAHVQRFWAPSMREAVKAYLDSGGDKLQPIALKAVTYLDATT